MSDQVKKTWRDKAHRIIGLLCKDSYLKANTTKRGKFYCHHKAYTIPLEAVELIKCLDNNDEEMAKAMFLNNYEIERVVKENIR